MHNEFALCICPFGCAFTIDRDAERCQVRVSSQIVLFHPLLSLILQTAEWQMPQVLQQASKGADWRFTLTITTWRGEAQIRE